MTPWRDGTAVDTREPVSMFGPEVSAVYDLFYLGRGKEFAAEADVVASTVKAREPEAATLLDVACGTGEHLRSLRGHFTHVEGLEQSPDMRSVAMRKLPDVPVHAGDMRDFDLGSRFDAVCSLFSAVSYLPATADLDAAIATMARHLRPGGVLVIDPWWFPDQFLDGFTDESEVRDEQRVVRRRSHSRGEGKVVRHEAEYHVTEPSGTWSFRAVQLLTMFTRAEYLTAFARAGCSVEYLEDTLSERGLFVGRRL
jgi:SAM-dependent methyltransferase